MDHSRRARRHGGLTVEFEQITAGVTSEWSRTVTERDVVLFAECTGDCNPVHMDAEAAAASPFAGRIAHGMLSAGFISAAIARGVPGPGSIYLSQTLTFKHAVRIGDTVTVRLEVLEVKARSRRVRLSTVCRNQEGTVVLDGEASVLAPAGVSRAPSGAQPLR
jgi:3-hydroxybutyryl-CoA dehydratase